MLQAKKAAEAELSAMKEALMEREKRFEQQLNQLDAERRHLQNTLVMEQAQVSALENQLSTTKMRADEWRKKAETLGRTIDTMLEVCLHYICATCWPKLPPTYIAIH